MGHPAVTHGRVCRVLPLDGPPSPKLPLIVVYIRVLLHLPDGRRGIVLLQCQTWQRVAAMPDVAHGVAALPRLPHQ